MQVVLWASTDVTVWSHVVAGTEPTEILQDLQKDEVHVWVVDDSSSQWASTLYWTRWRGRLKTWTDVRRGTSRPTSCLYSPQGPQVCLRRPASAILKPSPVWPSSTCVEPQLMTSSTCPSPCNHMSASLLGDWRMYPARGDMRPEEEVLCPCFLEGLCTASGDGGPVHRGAVPLPGQPAPGSRGEDPQSPAGSGKWSQVRRVEEVCETFRRNPDQRRYGLTEVSVGFLNYTDKVGPIGRASFFNKRSMPFELLSMDPQTSEPFRTAAGRCVRARRGETGVLVTPLTVSNQFLGYAGDQVQTEKKLLRDVFSPGDVFFNTGDLMSLDQHDFLYFRDRVGDTFRWKGENVSTMEVSEVLCQVDFIQEATVYGVSVPGHEGRAGMSAVVLKDGRRLDGRKLFEHLEDVLPSYAWPRFLRVQSTLEVTQTFKQQKMSLVRESFNPSMNSDMLYFLDMNRRDFTRLTASVYNDIMEGNVRL
ncbi:unnamed protein product [Lampetra planeri]